MNKNISNILELIFEMRRVHRDKSRSRSRSRNSSSRSHITKQYKLKSHSKPVRKTGGIITSDMIHNISDKITTSTTPLNYNNLIKIGEGGYGVVARIPNTFVITKIIKSTSVCRDAYIEANKHLKMFRAWQLIMPMIQPNFPASQFAYIPEPYSFENFPNVRTFNLGGKHVDGSCTYSMEYMQPIDLGDNRYNNELIPLHIVVNKQRGFLADSPYRGFMCTGLKALLTEVRTKYPSVIQPNDNEVLNCIGALVGIALFICELNPKDFQFMLGMHRGIFKVIGFDFGMFHNELRMIDAVSDIIFSPYIGEHLNDDTTTINAFLQGINAIVEQMHPAMKGPDKFKAFTQILNGQLSFTQI